MSEPVSNTSTACGGAGGDCEAFGPASKLHAVDVHCEDAETKQSQESAVDAVDDGPIASLVTLANKIDKTVAFISDTLHKNLYGRHDRAIDTCKTAHKEVIEIIARKRNEYEIALHFLNSTAERQ
jgi:hypothetical protein